MYELNGQKFFRKYDAEAYVRLMVNFESFNAEDPLWFELISMHPEAKEKIGCGIERFEKRTHPLNKLPCLYIIRKDGSEIDFSWKSCLTGKGSNPRALLLQAMREAVADQIQDYKTQNYRDGIHCLDCYRVILSRQDAHVDHIEPFTTITKKFFKVYGPDPKMFDDCPKTNRAVFRRKDFEYRQAWWEYHRKNAYLRIVCASCNLRKGSS